MIRKEFPQGYIAGVVGALMSELKLRPPKERVPRFARNNKNEFCAKHVSRGLKATLSRLKSGASSCQFRRMAILVALVVFAAGPLVIAQTTYSQRAKVIGMHLKCQCRGCDMSAGGCAHPGGAFSGPCDTAKAMLKEVDQHLAKGETQQQIIDAFVAEYGSTVYIEPPKHGFGLVAWIMPFVYTLGGLAVVVFVVNKWSKRPASAGPAAPAVPNEKLDRVRAEIDRETDD